jgi:hypothetical protein
VTFYIQEGRVGERRRIVDTAQLSPQDIVEPGQEQPFGAPTYEVQPRSVVVSRYRIASGNVVVLKRKTSKVTS